MATPRRVDIEEISHNTAISVVRWLERKGLASGEPNVDDRPAVEHTALDACLQASLGLGELVSLKEPRLEPTGHETPEKLGKTRRRAAKSLGFDVDAGVLIGPNQRPPVRG